MPERPEVPSFAALLGAAIGSVPSEGTPALLSGKLRRSSWYWYSKRAMPMAQILRSYSGSENLPGSIFVMRPASICAVTPQRGLAWQLGSQTVLT